MYEFSITIQLIIFVLVFEWFLWYIYHFAVLSLIADFVLFAYYGISEAQVDLVLSGFSVLLQERKIL